MVAATPPSQTAVLSDLPVVDDDKLDFAPYANTIANIILNPKTSTPLTIGIFGSWGSGKTSLMRMVERRLKSSDTENNRMTHSIWFNAWLYSKEDALWRALITQVMAGIRRMAIPGPMELAQVVRRARATRLDELATKLYRVAGASDFGSMSISAASLFSRDKAAQGRARITLTLQQGLDLLENLAQVKGDAETTLRLKSEVEKATAVLERTRVEALDMFREEFEEMVNQYVLPFGYLVIFVDDLDRCLPDKAVEVLEVIKLFLDAPGCIFILGIDQDVVERGIRLRYGELGKGSGQMTIPLILSAEALEAAAEDRSQDGSTRRTTARRSKALGDKAAEYRTFVREFNRAEEDVIDGGRYLEKIIQIPFMLPPISRETLGRFIAQMAPHLPHIECGNVFARGLEANPRKVKRAIGIFTLLWELSRNKAELMSLITPVRLAKIVVIQQRHPDIYDLLREDPTQLREWEIALRLEEDKESLNAWAAEHNLKELPKAVLPADVELYERLPALKSLFLMHHLSGELSQGTNFIDLSPEEAQALIFLTRTVKESEVQPPPTRPETVTPPVSDVSKEGDRVTRLTVGGDLDESAVGFISQRALDVMADLSPTAVSGAEYPADTRQKALESLAYAGGEVFLQITRDPKRHQEYEEALVKPTTIQVAAVRSGAQIPWEVVYDRPLPAGYLTKASYQQTTQPPAEIVPAGFWGFKHVIERPLLPPGRTDRPYSEPTNLAIAVSGRPVVTLVLDKEARLSSPVRSIYEQWASQGRIDLLVVEQAEEVRQAWGERPAEVNVVYGRGATENGEIRLSLGKDPLNLRTLASWGVETSRWGIREPWTSLWIFDVGAGLVSQPQWVAWLERLHAMGAGGVIAPLTTPHASWSSVFLSGVVDNYLKGHTVGEALRDARSSFLESTGNPLSLAFAHFGPAELRLNPATSQAA